MESRKEEPIKYVKTKIILIGVFAFLVGFGIGYTKGVADTVNYGVKILTKLVDLKKLNVEVDETMIKNGILQYKENIAGCLFLQNASISND